jgi:hypothetical protein
MRDPVSRREAAQLLGFASEFKVRALERDGTLRATRGIMGSAWYDRTEVLVARAAQAAGQPPGPSDHVATPGNPRSAQSRTDADLIAYLRAPVAGGAPLRTVADLVADMGISIARAQKVFRFWLAHDAHPTAAAIRAARAIPSGGPSLQTRPDGSARASERRSPVRVARAGLIRELRDADPAVRKAAFEELKRRRPSADAS